MAIWSDIFKEHLNPEEVSRRHLEQRNITAQYLNGSFGEGDQAIEIYNSEMNKVATPIDLVALASEVGFKKIS